MYGSYFDIAFSRPDSDTFEMRVDRCFFRDFFDRHDARPVTTALCGWDANWMQALDPATSGLLSERTTLLSSATTRADSASCAPTTPLPITMTHSTGNDWRTSYRRTHLPANYVTVTAPLALAFYSPVKRNSAGQGSSIWTISQ